MAGYEIIDGIKCYAPASAFQNNDFPSESFDKLYTSENTNFWFVSRNKVIKSLVKKYLPGQVNDKSKFLEIGCGTGFVLKGLSENKSLELSGAEIYLQGLKYAKKRLPDVEFIQLDATDLPFDNYYNAIAAFDVLEHIEEDESVMKNVYKALKQEGYFFITVPQYMWMWSKTDDYACHKRRYTRIEMKSKLQANGFYVEYMSSFVFTLFPFMVISRFISKLTAKRNISATDISNAPELNINPVINSIFRFVMRLDEFLISRGISLPFGGSLLMVAKKTTGE